MKTLSESLNMKFGNVSDAYVMNDVKQLNSYETSYETLSLICSELNIDLSNISDSDFDSASIILSYFCSNANDETGYQVSVWFS